jgi:hypothetical protein
MVVRCLKVPSLKGNSPPALCGAAAQRRHGFLVLEFSRSHTMMHHSRCNSSGREIGSSQRFRIRTHNPNKQATADPSLRTRGHGYRLKATYSAGVNIRHTFYTKINSTVVPYMGYSAEGSVKNDDCLYWLHCCHTLIVLHWTTAASLITFVLRIKWVHGTGNSWSAAKPSNVLRFLYFLSRLSTLRRNMGIHML